MKTPFAKITGCVGGFTLIEVVIALFMTGLITSATFGFLKEMEKSTSTQIDVSETSLLCRTSMWDIKKTLRSAGARVAGLPAYEVKGDTLVIHASFTKPVDTIRYYLEEYTDAEYAGVPGLPSGSKLFKLMKKTNSAAAGMFADNITDIDYTIVNAANLEISLTAQAPKADESYNENNGFRTFTLVERVNVRNQ